MDDELWDDDDDELFEQVAEKVEESEKNKTSTGDVSDMFDDEDDLLMQSIIEEESEETVETKDKADEDDYAALNLKPPEPQHTEFLSTEFGHGKFKPLQWRIIQSVLVERRDQCVVMSTGYGKSLCYQAHFDSRCTLRKMLGKKFVRPFCFVWFDPFLYFVARYVKLL